MAPAAHAAAPLPASQHPEGPLSEAGDMSGLNNPYLLACLNAFAHNQFSRGEQYCNLAIMIDPKDSDALEMLGYGFLLQHRFERAAAEFAAALQINPDKAEVLAGYGRSLTGLGDYAGAVTQFEKAVALVPGNSAYHNGLCWARTASGKNLNVALSDCNTALRLAPGAPGPLNSRGLAELRLNRFSDAVTDYTASLKVQPLQPSARFGRGLAYLALGQITAGSADIVAARARDPDMDGIFTQMGILPENCDTNPKCPAGFPPVAKGNRQVAQR